MRIKYFGAKIAIIVLAIAATPVVWGALAWPEWSKPNESAWGEAVTEADSQLSAVDAAAPEPTLAPPPTPEIIRRTVVIERPVYIDVAGTGGGISAPQAAGTAAQTQFAAVPAAVISSAPSGTGAPPAAPTGNAPASAPAPAAPPPPPPPAPATPPAPTAKPAPTKAPSSGTTKGS